MKIQIASDLHLKFFENREWLDRNPIIPTGDVLVLAGDIVVNKYRKKARNFFRYIESKFRTIIRIHGNHEFYGGEIAFAYPSYYKEVGDNHFLINNKSIVIDEAEEKIKFIGSVLWSYIPEESKILIGNRMNDYRMIFRKYGSDKVPIGVDLTNLYNKVSINFLREELKKSFKGKIVFVTHHLPVFECIDEEKDGMMLNHAYANSLNDYIENNPRICLWIHGHSHTFKDINMGETRIIRNPMGYVSDNEHLSFRRNLVVEI